MRPLNKGRMRFHIFVQQKFIFRSSHFFIKLNFYPSTAAFIKISYGRSSSERLEYSGEFESYPKL